MSQHPFVVEFQDTLIFTMFESEGVLTLRGTVHCQKDIDLSVTKVFDVRYFGNAQRVKCHTYRYVGFQRGGHLLLKYHNLHRDWDDYVHRTFDPLTGDMVIYEILQRYQFPTFSEVLDELEYLARDL